MNNEDFTDFGFSLIESGDLDTDLDPDYDPFPLDHIPTDSILESYLRENPPMAKGKNKGRHGKKKRAPQKAKAKVVVSTVAKATKGSAAAGKAATRGAFDGYYDDMEDWDDWNGGGLGLSTFGTGGKTTKTTGGAATAGFMGKCRHYNTVDSGGLNIKGLTFYPSSMNNNRKGDDLIPDWGLYLDWGWKHPDWRAENIDWRDYGLPSNYVVAFEAMLEVIERAQRGEKVEIGCIGGHGRTGTALACIAVMLGMTAKEAIKHVRTQYCDHTLETDEQEWFVSWVEAQMLGIEAPEKPERKVVATTYKPKPPAVCNQYEHFYMWLRDAKACTKRQKACVYFHTAMSGFDKQVPAYLLGDNDLEWHRKAAKAYQKHPKDPNKPKTYGAGSGGKVIPPAKPKPMQATSSPKSELPPLPKKRPQIVVGDYLVPKPGMKEAPHREATAKGCICDVCRYLDAGFEAFLEPYDLQLGAARQQKLDNLETQAEANIRIRKIQEATIAKSTPPPLPETGLNQIWINTSDKGLVAVNVDSNFDKPPGAKGVVSGERRGKFVWTNEAKVWVYMPKEEAAS